MRVLLMADLKNFQLPELTAALRRRGTDTLRIPPAHLTRVHTQLADTIILDPGLPYHESIAICRKVRTTSDVPIIMISRRSERADRVRGLRSGADDYVTPPYDFDELVAKIVVATRPRGPRNTQGSPRLTTRRFGDISMDLERMAVTASGARIELTKKEFQMLTLIANEGGAVCSREKLATEVWGRPAEQVSASIQILISRLRAKIGYERIKTVRGIGYQLVSEPTEARTD